MDKMNSVSIAIAWCLAWGNGREPQFDIPVLEEMCNVLRNGGEVPEAVREIVNQVEELQSIDDKYFPNTLEQLKTDHPKLWNQTTKIGLVYGGVTKVKQYVFESEKLPDIRGASGLLDQINVVDLPAFFNKPTKSNLYRFYDPKVRDWLQLNFPDANFLEALIPELIIYSCGGNILAFCPTAFIDDLANAIEKRYTYRTLTANSCAVGDTFRLLEIRFGLLRDNIEDTFWLEQYKENYADEIVGSYFGKFAEHFSLEENFKNRKSFNELTTKLAILFNQRRSGNDIRNRPTRRYPAMFETHPYLRRDETEKRSAITFAEKLPGQPYYSESSAIKRKFGDRVKTGESKETEWYKEGENPINDGWIQRFENFLNLKNNEDIKQRYIGNMSLEKVEIAKSLTHLGKVSNGYIAYIYADGNNMGGAIQKIRIPQEYQNFSQDVDNATRYAVFIALAENLKPRKLQGIDESTSNLKNGDLIHPFEILTIGGDDILLIVPADKALQIAKMIGESFEKILLHEIKIPKVRIKGDYEVKEKLSKPHKIHRFVEQISEYKQCSLSMSSGILLTAYNTPIYYAEELTEQLMKSAKKYAKSLQEKGFYGGTVDFFTMKSVTMISSSIEDFRKKALIFDNLKLYAAPYTLPELERLLQSIQALQRTEFPKSQLYQIRSFLAQGRRTASLNYYYFCYRLNKGNILKENFEDIWCPAKTNKGNVAPWMYNLKEEIYETIWREMVDLFDLIKFSDTKTSENLEQEIRP